MFCGLVKVKRGGSKGWKKRTSKVFKKKKKKKITDCRLYSISLVKHDITQYTKTRNSTTL